jgi:hypothetical protein
MGQPGCRREIAANGRAPVFGLSETGVFFICSENSTTSLEVAHALFNRHHYVLVHPGDSTADSM